MSSDINLKDYVVSRTKVPTYLEELLLDEKEITLVFLKGRLTSSNSASNLLDTLDITSNTSLNLTGRPLEVDLNLTSNSLTSEVGPTGNTDVNLRPMGVDCARKYINHYNRQIKIDQEKPPSVYCMCDGSDICSTILLGSSITGSCVVSRTLMLASGSVEDFRTKSIMDRMVNQHLKNVQDDISPKIDTKVTCIYDVFGYKLNPTNNIETTLNAGCIIIEADWNTPEFNIPEYGASIKMFLQVMVSHENSFVYSNYQKLVLLQKCLNLIKDGTLDDNIILCDLCDAKDDVYNRICSVLHDVIYMKPTVTPQDMQQALLYMEENNLTDKLWNILSCSRKLVDLKDALNSLFNLINNEPIRVQLLDDDLNTALGTIIKNIYEGKMLVPTLTSKQSLELLVELGLQKIKRIYTFIVKSYDFSVSNQLEKQWSKVNSGSVVKSKANILDQCDWDIMSKNLDFLYSVHVMLEFLQLIEQNYTFTKEVGISVLKNSYTSYVDVEKRMGFSERKQVFDLVFSVTYADIKLAVDCPPLRWRIRMISTKKNPWFSSITTLFHYSRKPLYPDYVYKYKDSQFASDDDQQYYVTQLETYSDAFPV